MHVYEETHGPVLLCGFYVPWHEQGEGSCFGHGARKEKSEQRELVYTILCLMVIIWSATGQKYDGGLVKCSHLKTPKPS